MSTTWYELLAGSIAGGCQGAVALSIWIYTSSGGTSNGRDGVEKKRDWLFVSSPYWKQQQLWDGTRTKRLQRAYR